MSRVGRVICLVVNDADDADDDADNADDANDEGHDPRPRNQLS